MQDWCPAQPDLLENGLGKRIISFGEVLWDMLPSGPVLGGAPCNFAFRANSLGDEGLIVSRLGVDKLGDDALKQIEKLGMDARYIQRDDEYATGTVDITFDANQQPSYVINPGVAYDYIGVNDKLLDAVKSAECLCFGTLAQRNEQSRKTLAAMLEQAFGALKILDINLRKDCYTRESVRTSMGVTNVLKLNHEELDELAEMFALSGEGIVDRADELLDMWQLKHCLVTLGEKGAYAADDQGRQIYVPGYRVKLADPCGSGDAFSAGFIHLLLRGQAIEMCCVLGNALGAMVAEQVGATIPISHEEIDRFMAEGRGRVFEEELKSLAYIDDGGILWTS